MTEFHDVRFPTSLAFGASGGPEFSTEIIQLSSGQETRNTPHALPRRRYNAISGLKSVEQIVELKEFFISRKGSLHSFRFLDPFDNQSCPVTENPAHTDQFLAIGDGVKQNFHLQKTYSDMAGSLTRPITKPHENSVLLAIDGTAISGNEFSVDGLSGQVDLNEPLGVGKTLTAGFRFDTVVRFDTDYLDLVLEDFGAVELRDIPLVELPYA